MTTKSAIVAGDAVTSLKGVGAALAERLEKLSIRRLEDLLFHLPLRYLDRTRITPLSELRTHTSVMVEARVVSAKVVFGRRRSLAVSVEDGGGDTTLRFYHFSAAQQKQFVAGRWVRAYGDPRLGSSGLEFYHPEYRVFEAGAAPALEDTLTPIYPLTDGLSQARLRGLIEQAFERLERTPPQELIPAAQLAAFKGLALMDALKFLHFPPAGSDLVAILEGRHPSQRRLALEEFTAHYLVRQQQKRQDQAGKAPSITIDPTAEKPLLDALPFRPTEAQQRVCQEICRDLASGPPMLRMVQGDVGSGKTLVATLVGLQVCRSGYQVALAAPTELLAEQHFRALDGWLSPLGLRLDLLVGKLSAGAKKRAQARLENGETDWVIGTHALFQSQVSFARLGLAIIDEQHRFGVEQRRTLRHPNPMGEMPHQLVMTATPIPRTLAMTAYADLDYSVIDALPPGRTPIQTALISQTRRQEVIARLLQACRDGAQAYWVCPLVEDSESLSAANAEESVEQLRLALPDLCIDLVHGRMKAEEKTRAMSGFARGETQVLVATTVIEVGVDVPNASLMVIENPERLGLAQLHQLRGRVGRGERASHCVLMYGDKLSQQARQRLKILRESNDGFVIAERDMQLRGPGEVLGTRQAGDMQYRVADLGVHADLIPRVHALGKHILRDDERLADALIERWIGDRLHYAQV